MIYKELTLLYGSRLAAPLWLPFILERLTHLSAAWQQVRSRSFPGHAEIGIVLLWTT